MFPNPSASAEGGLVLIGLLTNGLLVLYATRRADVGDQRVAAGIDALNQTEQQRHLDGLRVQRGERLKEVSVSAEEALSVFSRILTDALKRPITLKMVITASAAPVPALTVESGKGEMVVTTSADAYVEQVLVPARRLAKLERPETVSILPSLDSLVVDEEVYQCFAHLAASLHVDTKSVRRVEIWQAIVLPEMKK